MKQVSRSITAKLSLGIVFATVLLASVATAQAESIGGYVSDCEDSPYFTESGTAASISTEAVSAVSDVESASDC